MTRYLLRHPPTILGRRGSVLLIAAIAWWATALKMATRVHWEQTDLFGFIPAPLHVTIWALAGAVAAWAAFQRKPGADRLGFVAIVAIAVPRAFTFAWACLDSVLPWGGPGDPSGWFGAICWGAIAMFAITVAGWPEAPVIVTLDDPETVA